MVQIIQYEWIYIQVYWCAVDYHLVDRPLLVSQILWLILVKGVQLADHINRIQYELKLTLMFVHEGLVH